MPLDADLTAEGKDRDNATASMAFLFGISGAFSTKGNAAIIKQGERFTAFVAADRQIRETEQAAETPAPLGAIVEATQAEVKIKIEEDKKLKPIQFRVSEIDGQAPSLADEELRATQIHRIAGEELGKPLSVIGLAHHADGTALRYDRWQVVSYCRSGSCEVSLTGKLPDGRTWEGTTDISITAE